MAPGSRLFVARVNGVVFNARVVEQKLQPANGSALVELFGQSVGSISASGSNAGSVSLLGKSRRSQNESNNEAGTGNAAEG